MYLKRLEIAGFKSFGSRIKLDFQPGVSAIVGPNGSGKSNVADAIRWVMGEQNVRSLRASKTEELIYAGSDSAKAKASMAEVTLTLVSDPKGRKSKLAVSELVVNRRLYRSGETEYRLAGRKVLVKDLQRILAQAGFGTSSYSVISQGMIDTLLIASPTERKVLFEEASGIRGFELERVDTVRKLKRATEQAEQLRSEVMVLAPEREALARQVKQIDRQRELKSVLQSARQAWLNQEQQRLTDSQSRLAEQTADLKQRLEVLESERKTLEVQAKSLEQAGARSLTEQAHAIRRLEELDGQRTTLAEKIAGLQARAELAATETARDDRPQQIKAAIKANTTRLDQYKAYFAELTTKTGVIEAKIAVHNEKIAALNSELTTFRQQLNANQRNEYLGQALSLARLLNDHLQGKRKIENSKVRVVVHRLIRMVKLASESDMTSLPTAIAKAQQNIARELGRREDIVDKQTNEIIKLRSVELDINALEKELAEQTKQLVKLETSQAKSDRSRLAPADDLAELIRKRDELETASREQRAALANLTGAQTTSDQVDLAHAIEQARAAQTQTEAELDSLRQQQTATKQFVADLQATAKDWKLTITQPTSSTPIDATELTRLETELAILADIDEGSVEAHTELSERVDYLEQQATDLEQAVADLSKVLAELERRIKDTFETNFGKINQAFAGHFAELFHGGTAALKLTPAEDGSYGIEITAKPPGKRVELLSSLSGGEKAMAALALLAAILEVNPSPFIVLDEVDAALDDANSQAFTKMLARLAKHSQLLVITHNHETMLQADELFGITTSAKTSSTVISVDLRQAEALAA